MMTLASEIGGLRPISSCNFDTSGTQLAISDWTGTIKVRSAHMFLFALVLVSSQILDARTLAPQWSAAAHGERAQHVVWANHRLLSGGADSLVRLWDPSRPGKKANQTISFGSWSAWQGPKDLCYRFLVTLSVSIGSQ